MDNLFSFDMNFQDYRWKMDCNRQNSLTKVYHIMQNALPFAQDPLKTFEISVKAISYDWITFHITDIFLDLIPFLCRFLFKSTSVE